MRYLIILFLITSCAATPKEPTLKQFDFEYIGHASWYGKPFHGRRTASGDVYDMNKLTAAHKGIPLDSIVKVTNTQNGKSVMVLVNDRGPYIDNRDIDLSYAAAQQIGMIQQGVVPIKMEVKINRNKFKYRR